KLSAQYLDWVMAQIPRSSDRLRPVLEEADRSGQADLVLQLIDQFSNEDVSPLRERLVERFDDPWHRMRLPAARRPKPGPSGRPEEADRVPRAALDACVPESLTASCLYVSEELADVYLSVGRPADARRVLASVAVRTRAAGLYPHERKALMAIAEITARSGDVAPAR